MRGCIKVTTTSTTGYEAVLALRDPGDLIGEMAGLDGGPRSATLLALTEVDLLVVPAARFASLRSSRLAVEAAVNKVVSTRLREADRYRAAAGAQPAPQRLALLLLHLVERYGITDPDGTRIGMPLSHERWRGGGVVITRRRMITVCQSDELRRIGETG
jgi:CRP-like cAMP-binding protein